MVGRLHLHINQRRLAPGPDAIPAGHEETMDVQTMVFAVIPKYHQVKVRSEDGHVYSLTRKTQGVRLDALREGQRVVCRVTRRLPRVLSAEVLA